MCIRDRIHEYEMILPLGGGGKTLHGLSAIGGRVHGNAKLLQDVRRDQQAVCYTHLGRYLAPGFIDIHSHGGGGFDYMDGSAEDIVVAARAHLRHGTTSVLPTTMTSSDEDLFLTIDNFKEAKKVRENMPDLLGLHLEGPYFDMVEKGAQPDQYIQNPRPEHYMLSLIHIYPRRPADHL